MATHSSILLWEIPWTEGPDELQSVVSQSVRYDRATEHPRTHYFMFEGQYVSHISTPNDGKTCSELCTKDSENPPGGHHLLMKSVKDSGMGSES